MTASSLAATYAFDRTGGSVAADFTNTLDGSRADPGVDHLAGYGELVEFARQTALVNDATARRLLSLASRRPEKATQIHRRAIALREAAWRAFDRIAEAREPDPRDLAVIADEAKEALANAALVMRDGTYAWMWTQDDDLGRALWPLARAVSDVLTSEDEVTRLRECASDTCGWIFVDRTKNRSRRWCDMRGCGNRAKVRAFRQREKRTARKSR